jgi:hypothetical protein
MHVVTVNAIALVEFNDLRLEDQGIAAQTKVSVDSYVPEGLIANAALDIFHSCITVSEPKNFRFEVRRDDKVLEEGEGCDSFEFSESGDVL